MEAYLIQQLKGNLKVIEGHGMALIMVDVANEQQSEPSSNVRNGVESKCESRAHEAFNNKKRFVYIQNNNLADLASFQAGLQRVYPIIDVERTTWIKPRKSTTIPNIGQLCRRKNS